MKIGFDISQTCESKSGTGFFADQIIRALAALDNENQYILLPWFYDYRPQTLEKATQIRQKNFTEKVLSEFNDDIESMGKMDIVHSNNFRFPKDISAKKVVTIYDVCFMDHPEYTTEANRLFCYQGTLDSLLWADKIIAISEYTKQRLLHFFPFVNEKKIEVVYCGNRDTLQKEKANEKVIEKFDLRENDYFLSVGTIEPRKNYGTLLKAYKEYKEKNKEHKKLCIAGGYGWMQENFKNNILDLGLEEDVIITGYVSDEQLANLYRYCFAFVYPTWYEGFGLPVLEAMNFQKPVIASNVASLPEIVGDNAILINPKKYEELIDALELIEKDKDKYTFMVKNSAKIVEGFSWKNSANRILEIYKNIKE